REEYCAKTWRWDLECALNATLSEEEIGKGRALSLMLKGEDCSESSWNILQWVEEEIVYDTHKSSLPTPTIVIKGREITIKNPERVHQTPAETVELGRGICGDYAILTSALLLNLNCKPYIFRFDFASDDVGHLTSAIFVDQYYIIDQKLPPMDLGSYYKKWLKEGKKITRAFIYERGLQIGEIGAEEMQKFDYDFTQSDLEFMEELIRDSLRKRLREDPWISRGYKEYAILKITFYEYAEFYTPLFAEKIALKMVKDVLERVDETNRNWVAFKVELRQKHDDILVEVHLAK
ncbi:MAG: hypothetical protein N3D09_02585, partial [Archaeoglobaceae archaeon]|nr:hypothetical protein [Archaeoglobaceae archaeon]